MTLIDNLGVVISSRASDLVEETAPKYFDDMIAEGRTTADTLGDDSQEANAALDALAEIKQPLMRLTNLGLAEILGHWQSGDEAAARREYLAHRATFMERRAAMHAAGDGLVDDEDERRASWDAVAEGLKKVGTLGLKFLGGLMLKSLGIPI